MDSAARYVTNANPVTAEITNRAALALLEKIEARRLANEELAAAASEVIDQSVYGNRAEAYQTALRIVVRHLPRIIEEAERLPEPDRAAVFGALS